MPSPIIARHMTVISYPIPAYQNVPIHPEYYQPSRFVISGITLGQTTIVTTATNMDYVVGQLVRLLVPWQFGTRQLNQTEAYVISIPAPNQVELDVPSVGFDTFIASSAPTKAQIVAVGDINQGQQNTNGRTNQKTYIRGSFINISP